MEPNAVTIEQLEAAAKSLYDDDAALYQWIPTWRQLSSDTRRLYAGRARRAFEAAGLEVPS